MTAVSTTRSTGRPRVVVVLKVVARRASSGVDLYLEHCRRMDAWERRRSRARRARVAARARAKAGGPGARQRPDRVGFVWWWRYWRARLRSKVDRLLGR